MADALAVFSQSLYVIIVSAVFISPISNTEMTLKNIHHLTIDITRKQAKKYFIKSEVDNFEKRKKND